MGYGKLVLAALLVTMATCPAWGAVKSGSKAKAKEADPPAEKPAPAPPVNILSIIPAQGEPNMSVTLYGTGFSDKTTAFLGTVEVPTRVIGPQQLTFDIPKLAPGLYALFLKREDGTTSRTYNFSILAPKPYADSISPDSINVCSRGKDREVTVTGKNFQPGSQVLFDGSAIRSTYSSPESLSFLVPQVAGGLHQVQIKNPEDTMTTALALVINAKPEVLSISRGESYVNYYKLIIQGENFQPGASIVVEESSYQVGVTAGIGKRLSSSGASTGEREHLTYVDCARLVYQRYPADPTDKDLRIQVINPNGEASSVVQVTAP